MAHIVLFHSILGLRPAERAIADAFARDGHTVSLPDLFDGRTAETYDAAFVIKDAIGDAGPLAHARAALDDAPDDAVLAGVSWGAFLIGELWAGRPRSPGALLLCGPAPWMTPRARGLPVSCHIARPDPFDDEEFFTDWAAAADGVDLALHRYDGVGHYFLDPSLPDFDADAADRCMARARAFLKRLPS